MKRSPMPVRRSVLARRTGLKPGGPLQRSAVRRSAPRPAVPADVRGALGERSGGVCEPTVYLHNRCTGVATVVHHRIPRGIGGVHGEAREVADRLSSVLHCCEPCHEAIHATPAVSLLNGWLVRRGSDTTQVPVWVRRELVWLDDAGQVHDYEEGVA